MRRALVLVLLVGCRKHHDAPLLFSSPERIATTPRGLGTTRHVDPLLSKTTATIDERELAIAIPFTTDGPGAHAIRGQLNVCERDRCLPRSMPIAVEVN